MHDTEGPDLRILQTGIIYIMKYLSQTGISRAIFAIFLLMPFAISAQSSKNYNTNPPDWVKAMDNPNTNYFKAIKEYEKFWKNHQKPENEEVLMTQGVEQVKKHIRTLSKREIRQQREQDYYRYQCKRFENWMRENKPYVQDDGRILSPEERLKLWEKSQKERQ